MQRLLFTATSFFMEVFNSQSASGYRIVAMTAPRMAPADAPDSKPQSFEEAVFFQRFCGILRTGWSVSALSS